MAIPTQREVGYSTIIKQQPFPSTAELFKRTREWQLRSHARKQANGSLRASPRTRAGQPINTILSEKLRNGVITREEFTILEKAERAHTEQVA